MTTASIVDIFNLALDACGHSYSVASQLESSREAELCNRWYSRVYKTVGMAAHWNSLRFAAQLTSLSERDDTTDWTSAQPMPNWQFAYGLPTDFLAPQYMTDFSQFQLGVHSTHRAIFSNSESPAVLIFTRDNVSPALWDEGLTTAIIRSLAAVISRPLSAKRAMTDDNFRLANQAILDAREENANSSNVTYDHVPDWLAARGVSLGLGASNRFIYPYGELVSVSTV